MLDKGWQKGFDKDGTRRGLSLPDRGELCDFEKTRTRAERDSGTICRTLGDSLSTATPIHARQIKGFLKRLAVSRKTGVPLYLSMLHVGNHASVTLLSYETKQAALPVPRIELPWTARWTRAEIETGRKPEIS